MHSVSLKQARSLSLFYEYSPDSIALVNKSNYFERVNKAYAKTFQSEPSAFNGRPLFDYFPSELIEEWKKFTANKTAHYSFAQPIIFQHSPEQVISFWDYSFVTILDEKGEIEYVVFTLREVTERVETENALRDSQNRLALAAEAGGVGVWDWNLETQELHWDKSMFQLYGIREEDFSGAYEAWRSSVHPRDIERASAEVQASIDEKVPFRIEFRIVHPDGKVRYIKAFANTICDENGQVQRMVGTNWDITERRQAEARHSDLAQIVENSLNEIYIFDQESLHFIFVNRTARENLGYTMEELEKLTPNDIKPEFTIELFIKLIGPLKSGHKSKIMFETRHQRKDGTTYWVEVHLQKSTYANQPVYNAIILDITKRKEAEESMIMASSIYQSSAEAIMVTDDNNRIIDINPAFTCITGYTLEEVVGKDPRILKSGQYDEQFYMNMWQTILKEGHWQGELWDRRKNGEIYASWANISVIRHPDGSIYRYVGQYADISEAKEKDKLIWSQANYDMLTGLPNRRLLRDRLEQEIKKSRRNKLPFAVLFIDLDRFKEINDTMGHAIGDHLLEEAAQRIVRCVRDSDTVARLGGDEFTALLPDFGERQQIERIAQQIIEKLCEPFYFSNDANGYYISASIGITLYPDDGSDIETLLKNADQAMYQAKADGRQCFSYFTESMQQEAQEKLVLTRDLREALIRQEMNVYYQPIIDLADGRIVKSEALLRWHHSKRGMISPAVFIPLAEESGLIHEIGEWVFQESITNIEKWYKLVGRIVPVSVNKSPIQFECTPQKATWSDRLADLGLPGNCITVEITEGLLLKKSPKTKERLLEFQNSGIEVSIDDFGTGFSALSYLKQFDIDYLKIDRSFISKLTEDESDRVLTEAIIVMAHKLDIQTIAEGVETREQRNLLTSFGCDYAQGFFYAPAVPVNEFEQFLQNVTL